MIDESPERATPTAAGAPARDETATRRRPLPAPLARIDAWQRDRRVPSFVVAVARKSGDDRARPLAALIAHYAFFSIFPLLLVLVTLLGWVLSDDPSLRQRVLDSTVAQFPVIGDDLTGNIGAIQGSGVALAIGLLTALWAGMGMGLGMQYAFDTVWAVPRVERATAVAARVRALGAVAILGVALVVGSGATTFVAGVGAAPLLGRIGVGIIAVAAVAGAILGVFVVLTPSQPWSRLWIGALVSTVGWAALQVIGAWFVGRVVSRAGNTYGVFAVVIGLLVWLSLLARVLVVGAEVNAVLRFRLWPRALLGPPMDAEPTAADLAVYSSKDSSLSSPLRSTSVRRMMRER
ncbi:MAG: YihY/virulence factor BrkB family protein [Acidimicrobiales bacterium]